MSKIGNHRVEVQESDSYQLGRAIAELGLEVAPHLLRPAYDMAKVRLGWQDYHDQEKSK
jgi:hypothetical protein